MKKLIALLFVVLWIGGISLAMGATVLWDYDGCTDLAGFRIYVDGEMKKEISDPETRSVPFDSWDSDSDNILTMTAYDTAGQESCHSESVTYNPVPVGVTNVIINTETVTININ